jgi:hypothetical protein
VSLEAEVLPDLPGALLEDADRPWSDTFSQVRRRFNVVDAW